MLRPLRFLLLLLILLYGCYPVKKVVNQSYVFDKDVSFTIDEESEGSTLPGGFTSYVAKKGYKLVFITCTFKNNSATERDFYLSRFHLLDPESHTKYKIEFALSVSAIVTDKKIDSNIKGGEIVRRGLVFAFPKKEIPKTFAVDDNVYNFEYKPKD